MVMESFAGQSGPGCEDAREVMSAALGCTGECDEQRENIAPRSLPCVGAPPFLCPVHRSTGKVWQTPNIGKSPRIATIWSFLELYRVESQGVAWEWFAKHHRCYVTLASSPCHSRECVLLCAGQTEATCTQTLAAPCSDIDLAPQPPSGPAAAADADTPTAAATTADADDAAAAEDSAMDTVPETGTGSVAAPDNSSAAGTAVLATPALAAAALLLLA